MIILSALYFALPMYIANMAPVIVKRLRFLDSPIDGGKMYKGQPFLGENKTWRGVVSAIVFAILTICLQRYLFLTIDFFHDISLFDYDSSVRILLGFLFGFGAIFGDAIKSFLKRRLGRVPGSKWFPFDQLDFVVVGLLVSSPVFFPGWDIVLIILLATPALHMLVNYVSFKIGIKDVPW